MKLTLIFAAILLLNLPFGYWRASTRRFSPQWFLAVHVPVPLVIALRLATGAGWQIATFPLFVGAFLAGQFLGGQFKR
jgi:hypothetical protein